MDAIDCLFSCQFVERDHYIGFTCGPTLSQAATDVRIYTYDKGIVRPDFLLLLCQELCQSRTCDWFVRNRLSHSRNGILSQKPLRVATTIRPYTYNPIVQVAKNR